MDHPVQWAQTIAFAAKAGRSEMKWLYRSGKPNIDIALGILKAHLFFSDKLL
jgi:hypothetical protein